MATHRGYDCTEQGCGKVHFFFFVHFLNHVFVKKMYLKLFYVSFKTFYACTFKLQLHFGQYDCSIFKEIYAMIIYFALSLTDFQFESSFNPSLGQVSWYLHLG